MPHPAPMDPLSALESLATHFGNRLEVGVALEPRTLQEQGATVARHFRRLTAENAMKWGVLCPTAGHYEWAHADAIANFARQHRMRMTGHTLLWHQMQPRWLFVGDGSARISRSTLADRLQQHIFRVIERYADVVDNWDVVNEAVSDKPGELWRSQGSEWFTVFEGAEFVALAFRFAAEAVERYAPRTQLYYNDYEIENAEKRAKVIAAVRELRRQGVRVDGVGIQGHINLQWPTPRELERTIDDFAAEQLLVKVSELDISVYTEDQKELGIFQSPRPYDADLEAALAERYVEVFRVLLARSQKLTSVVLWGLSDDRTWLNYYPTKRPNFPLLFGHDHQPKTALRRLFEL